MSTGAASIASGSEPPPIRLDGVSKWFGNVVAVSELTTSVGRGVTALLGPNGAGKSTVMRLMCGLAVPSQGTVELFGRDPRRDPSILAQLGLIPQQERLFPQVGALRFVQIAAELSGVDDPEGAARAVLAVVELDAEDRRPVDTYSKGMRQRVKVAQALVAGPSILVADEPLSGLDPRQRQHLVDLFAELGRQGRTVLISSHVLDEVERFGSRVLVIARGRLVAEGDFHRIRQLMDDRPHLVAVRTDRPHRLAAELLARGVISGARVSGADHLRIETPDIVGFGSSIAADAVRIDARLLSVEPLDDDLESVFRYLVDDPVVER